MNDAFRAEWLAFELEEFPAECLGRTVDGQTWEQVDAVAAACISTHLASGKLDADCLRLMDEAIIRLAEMAALAEEDVRSYFVRLLELARQAREDAAR